MQGSNDDGLWSQSAVLDFKFIPHPLLSYGAFGVYLALIIFGVYWLVKQRILKQQSEADEKRRAEELEQAREFQMSLIPQNPPSISGFEFALHMKTSTEVGGDYYDFFPQENNVLYVVCGDATGHGLNAGMMVSITKAGLYGIPSIPPNEIATRLNTVIKAIDLGLNRMAFNMARFWEDKVEFTSAAMPPAYHYRAKTKDVDEILLGGLPLGSIKDETFSLEEFSFEKGDSLIFISDGLPEATNKENEMLGYEAVFECVKSNGEKNAESQKQALLDLGTSWLGDLQNQDDITIVVVKKTISLD